MFHIQFCVIFIFGLALKSAIAVPLFQDADYTDIDLVAEESQHAAYLGPPSGIRGPHSGRDYDGPGFFGFKPTPPCHNPYHHHHGHHHGHDPSFHQHGDHDDFDIPFGYHPNYPHGLPKFGPPRHDYGKKPFFPQPPSQKPEPRPGPQPTPQPQSTQKPSKAIEPSPPTTKQPIVVESSTSEEPEFSIDLRFDKNRK